MIYKAVKKFVTLRGGRFAEKILSFDFTKFHQFQFSHIGFANHKKHEIYVCFSIYRGYLSRDFVTVDLFCFATIVLKDLGEMDENDYFDMSTTPSYNKNKTLRIDYTRVHMAGGMQLYIDIFMVDEKGEITSRKCVFEFFSDVNSLISWPSTIRITPTYCII